MYKLHTSNNLTHTLRRIALFAVAFMILACKHFDDPAAESSVPERVNISIADFKEIVGSRRVDIEQEMVIGGYVTSSDREGNFHRSFYIEDHTGGVEIMAGLYDLHRIFPTGYYITVDLKGCSAGINNGVLQVGSRAAEYSQYPTDYFYSRAMLDSHIKRYDLRQEVAPQPIQIEELSDKMCGRLVNVASLSCVTSEEGCWSGYSIFEDSRGQRIAVYTSPYADYAARKIPDREVSITGIVQFDKVEGEDLYILKMRYESDCGIYN